MTEINADLIIEARWVVPVVPQSVVLENTSVVLRHGKIIDILPSNQASAYIAAQTIRLTDHALIPGLINLHTHAAMSLMRGLADDLPLMQWLQEHIWPTEGKTVSPGFVQDGTLLAAAEMLSGGTTCFNDMYFYPDAAARSIEQAGIRAQIGLVVLDFPSPYANDADDYLMKGLEARDGWRGNPLITSSLAPHAPYTICDATFAKVITYAEQLGIGIHTHLHETQDEIAQSLAQFGKRPLKRLAELGVLGPNFTAAHCVHVAQEEMESLLAYGSHVAHCPASNLKLGSGIAPISKLLSHEINVGIGTDGAASNNKLDMFAEMRLAALLAKGATQDPTCIPASQALSMATINGAKALGLDDKIGSIETGKMADLVAVKIASPETLPCFDPISHLVYVSGREHVTHTWVGGELRYQEGVYAGMEPTELKEITSEWQAKIRQHRA